MVDLTGDEDSTDDDGDNGMGDPTGGLVSLGGVGGIICSMYLALIISGYKGSRKPGGKRAIVTWIHKDTIHE
ncbi:hypothetical protein Tco_1321754 [Tanacetum coccineum]